MKRMVIMPKNRAEFKFINDLLKKLDVSSKALTKEELEDIGLSKMLIEIDKTKKVSNTIILQKKLSKITHPKKTVRLS